MSDVIEAAVGDDFTKADDPFALFRAWMAEAEASEINDPNAMSVATVDPDGLPNVRILLLKGFDEDGFVFYTNTESAKGRELEATPKCAICFHWKSLQKQVRARGPIMPVSAEEADAYYNSRSRGSRIGAWASQQSRPLESREYLEHAVSHFEKKFEGEEMPPRPEYWCGFRLMPLAIEFWQDGQYRLHDRVRFTREHAASPWESQRLFP